MTMKIKDKMASKSELVAFPGSKAVCIVEPLKKFCMGIFEHIL